MKYLIFIGLFAAGGFAGYIIGGNQEILSNDNSGNETQLITEFIHDTIIEKERIEVPVYQDVMDTIVPDSDT